MSMTMLSIECACGCGGTLTDRNEYGYRRKYIHGHNRAGIPNARRKERKLIPCACGCGELILDYDKKARPRRFKAGHNPNVYYLNKGGPTSPRWKGGRSRMYGYVMVWIPWHPLASIDGYVLEHRLVMERYLSEKYGLQVYLWRCWVVHHKNEIRDDNRVENLQVMSVSEHNGYHQTKRMVAKRQGVYDYA